MAKQGEPLNSGAIVLVVYLHYFKEGKINGVMLGLLG